MIDFLSSPVDTDIAYRWVQAVFPSDADTPYGAAFAVFTSSLTFIASLFMGWHIVVGIVSSAYSGKVLGERYHQIYAPLRVVLGFGMLVPIAGGFSSVHYLLRDVVGVAAVQMGNAPIVTYITAMAERGNSINVNSIQGRSLAETILNLQTCAVTAQGYNDTVGVWVAPARVTVVPEGRPLTYVSGNIVPSTIWDFGDCGSLTFRLPNIEGEFLENMERKLVDFHEARTRATDDFIVDISSAFADQEKFGEFFARKHYDPETTRQHVDEMKRHGLIHEDIVGLMRESSEKWNRAIAAAAAEVYADAGRGNKEKLVERINKFGFMVAGSYERTLSQMSGVVVGLANDVPSSTLSSPGYRYKNAFEAGLAAMQQARRERNVEAAGNDDLYATDGGGAMETVLSWVAPSMYNMKIQHDSPDPVGDMIAFGHNLLGGAAAAIAAMALGNATADAAGGSALALVGFGGFVAGALKYLLSWLGYLVLIALIVGIMHAYILPMLPMIMVFVMGVSWLVLFLEAAIAGVLWAFAFVRMDGQEFFDRNQAPGVSLLFNLFLRPAIGMLAFIGGLLLLPELLRGLSAVWDDAFYVQTGNVTLLAAIQWVVGLILFTWMQWHLSLRLYGLIPTIADRVGHWMGFQSHGYNDGQETTAAAGAMVAAGAAIAKAPVVPTGGGGGGGRGPRPPMAPSGVEPTKGETRKIAGNPVDPGKTRRTT